MSVILWRFDDQMMRAFRNVSEVIASAALKISTLFVQRNKNDEERPLERTGAAVTAKQSMKISAVHRRD
jgi:hypothetical protein